MKIAITGHRPNKLGNDYDLVSPLVLAISQEINKVLGELHLQYSGDIVLITGMALGIDTLFAQMAIENDTPFIAAIPFKGQEAIWPNKSKLRYYNILEKATRIVIVDENRDALFEEFKFYKPATINNAVEKMQNRNMWMVDNCDILIAVWDGTPGGTANCVQYATNKKTILRIDPKTILS